jgi:glucose-6-phosphate 1-dehydrogenase
MKSNDQFEPTVFVIFGGAGDLTWRKLVPALFDLSQDRSLPAEFAIIAVDRIKLGDDALRRRLHGGVNQFSRFGKAKIAAWNQFAKHIHYQQGDFKKPATYAALGKQCAKLEKEWGTKAHRIFYMATPPSMFGEIPKYLGKAGLARDREFARIVIEKPIGYDLESARALNAVLATSFDESQIFRMVSFHADEIRNKKVDVLHAARPILRDAVPQFAVRGQYGSGNVAGKKVPGYREENGVAPDSKTETFAALKLFLDNWRWQDVPFYSRTGKRLPQQASEISIQFRAVPHRSFPPEASLGWQPSRLVLSIQPDEGIVLGFQAKYPGPKMQLRPVDMRFSYHESFDAPSPDAYETLL